MEPKRLGAIESRFAEIVWAHAPLTSPELVRLCDAGLFENDRGTVRVLMSRRAYDSAQSTRFVDEAFSGSLPAFLAAFTDGKKLTPREVDELQRLIDRYREEG